MGEAVISWIIIIIIIVIIILIKRKKGDRREYSLGLKVAQEVQTLIKKKDYDRVETIVQKQSLNDITQIIDHVALSLRENIILKWNDSRPSDLSKLALAVYYLHMAWIKRSHKLAKSISKKQGESYFQYLQKCEDILETTSDDSVYAPEIQSRRIRLNMSLGLQELARNYFHNLSANYPDFLWPYLHYAEMEQPKWGGTRQNLEVFYESLPDDFLIQKCVELKLILDSKIMNDNYFTKYNNDIDGFARDRIVKIDEKFDVNSIDSVHKYIFFNYMEALSDVLGLKRLQKKYNTLMDKNYTIFPYGLLK